MKIDSHHHFWKYSAAEYGWIDGPLADLRRDFLPDELKREIDNAGIDGVVTVQVRQTVNETEWMLSLADDHSFIRGVVGWVPLADPTAGRILEQVATHPKLRGIRHVVQSEPDDRFILREDFNRGVSMLKDSGLAYDILIFERHLPHAIEFVDRHPNQVFVLDHVAKPRIRGNIVEPWRTNMRDLARRENVYCKVSGMVTEANFSTWTEAQLRPYFDVALGAFGPKRLMFGTDWPVCLAATTYSRWVETVRGFTTSWSAEERDWFFGRTATQAYRLED